MKESIHMHVHYISFIVLLLKSHHMRWKLFKWAKLHYNYKPFESLICKLLADSSWREFFSNCKWSYSPGEIYFFLFSCDSQAEPLLSPIKVICGPCLQVAALQTLVAGELIFFILWSLWHRLYCSFGNDITRTGKSILRMFLVNFGNRTAL